MGRLSRKKKIKAVDPFSKTHGHVLSFDPKHRNDPVAAAALGGGLSRKARTLMQAKAKLEAKSRRKAKEKRDRKRKRQEQEKRGQAPYSNGKAGRDTGADGAGSGAGGGEGAGTSLGIKGRYPGESMKAFKRRVNKARNAKLAAIKRAPLRGNNMKRKRYLARRQVAQKERDEVKGINKERADDDFLQLNAKDHVEFGEQAQRPPDIKFVPRKAAKRLRRKEPVPFGLSGAEKSAEEAAESGAADERAADYKRHQMELLRQQAQDAYKAMKQRKGSASTSTSFATKGVPSFMRKQRY